MNNQLEDSFINQTYSTLQNRHKILTEQMLSLADNKQTQLLIKEQGCINTMLLHLQKIKSIKTKLSNLDV